MFTTFFDLVFVAKITIIKTEKLGKLSTFGRKKYNNICEKWRKLTKKI